MTSLWIKVKAAIKLGFHKFVTWLNLSIKPDLLDFLDDNKDLATLVVIDVAKDLADEIGEVKRDEAIKRLVDAGVKNIPNLEVKTHWIALLVEVAVAVLKGQGKL